MSRKACVFSVFSGDLRDWGGEWGHPLDGHPAASMWSLNASMTTTPPLCAARDKGSSTRHCTKRFGPAARPHHAIPSRHGFLFYGRTIGHAFYNHFRRHIWVRAEESHPLLETAHSLAPESAGSRSPERLRQVVDAVPKGSAQPVFACGVRILLNCRHALCCTAEWRRRECAGEAGRSRRPRQWRVSGAGSTWFHQTEMVRPAVGALATVSQWRRGARVRLRRVLRQSHN